MGRACLPKMGEGADEIETLIKDAATLRTATSHRP
jgi:hypothetical protein